MADISADDPTVPDDRRRAGGVTGHFLYAIVLAEISICAIPIILSFGVIIILIMIVTNSFNWLSRSTKFAPLKDSYEIIHDLCTPIAQAWAKSNFGEGVIATWDKVKSGIAFKALKDYLHEVIEDNRYIFYSNVVCNILAITSSVLGGVFRKTAPSVSHHLFFTIPLSLMIFSVSPLVFSGLFAMLTALQITVLVPAAIYGIFAIVAITFADMTSHTRDICVLLATFLFSLATTGMGFRRTGARANPVNNPVGGT